MITSQPISELNTDNDSCLVGDLSILLKKNTRSLFYAVFNVGPLFAALVQHRMKCYVFDDMVREGGYMLNTKLLYSTCSTSSL